MNKELAQKIVDYLNDLTEMDRVAIAALISNHVPCNLSFAEHPTCIVRAQHGGFLVGLLGFLNGLCSDGDDDINGPIIAVFDDKGEGKFRDLSHFKIAEPGDF